MAAVLDTTSESLYNLITVVVTTSPTRSDPELDLIRATFASLSYAGLSCCPKILVADNFKEGGLIKGSYHRGTLPLDDIQRYNLRLELFSKASWAKDVTLLKLTSWHGFALATQRALELVETPLVCIVQHDLAFNRPINLLPVAELLCRGDSSCHGNSHPINYIALPKASTLNYRSKLRSKTGLEVGHPVMFDNTNCEQSVSLTRLPQFLDGTHVARVDWYRGIFEWPLLHGEKLTQGQFTEDNLGQFMLQQAKENNGKDLINIDSFCSEIVRGDSSAGVTHHQNEVVSAGVVKVMNIYGGWLWSDENCDAPIIFHLDGRVFLSAAERERRGIPNKDARYTIAESAAAFMSTQ